MSMLHRISILKTITIILFFTVSSSAVEYHHPTEKERLQIFESLINDIKELHIFSEITEANLHYNWHTHIEEYRRWFLEAKNKKELLFAIFRLQNSLHNPHCRVRLTEKSDYVSLGFEVSYQNDEKCPFYVSDILNVELAKKIIKRDCVKAIDGIGPADFLKQNFNVAPDNNLFYLNRAIASYLGRRHAGMHYIPENRRSTVEFESKETGKIVVMELAWKNEKIYNSDGSESGINYEQLDCGNMPPRRYGYGYTEIKEANNFCIYASSSDVFAEYPIIRFYSFSYDEERFVKNDFRILKDYLRQRNFKGFVLDLRDNGGGNNPNWFIEWFTNQPYYDRFVRMKLSSRLADNKTLSNCMMGGQKTQWYLRELEDRVGDQRLTSFRPFFCKPGSCSWDNKYYPKNRVSSLPFAILTGFNCLSSCDSFVYHFLTKHEALGVGERGSGGYTSHRLPLEIRNPADGSLLAYFTVAVSEDYDGETKRPIEGFSPAPDKEIYLTSENEEAYDNILIENAVKLIIERQDGNK